MILRRARWRLTLGFTAVQLITYAAFALAVYAYVTTTFDFDGIEDGGSASTAEAGFQTLRVALVLAFVCLVAVAPLTSWVLAGLAMRPVAETFAAQRRFVDDAAHELRTPLTAIQAQLELVLRRPRSVAEYQDASTAALEAAHALGRITDDLLVASEHPSERRTDESADVRAVVDVSRGLLAEPDRVHAEGTDSIQVRGSASALQRVITNLLVNACRYSDPDSAVVVRLGSRARLAGRAGWATIEVSDSGIGMNAAQLAHAFDRFWQADPSRAEEGSGLGLSIVRDIVTSLRGDVSIESIPGAGTTVRVRLPLSRSSHDPLRNVENDGIPV